MDVVWFRRDLRIHDHAALMAACASGNAVLPLYIFDPAQWVTGDYSERQFNFLVECLADLDSALRKFGSSLCLRVGTPVDVMSQLHVKHGISAIHTHFPGQLRSADETEQNSAVHSWALQAGVSMRQQINPGDADYTQRAENRDRMWGETIRQHRLAAPGRITPHKVHTSDWPQARDFNLEPDPCPDRQTGGRTSAVVTLRKFLAGAGRDYGKPGLPVTETHNASSHLSGYLSYGCLSVREVWQGAMMARRAFEEDGDTTFVTSLDIFAEKLRLRSGSQQLTENYVADRNGSSIPADTFNRPVPEFSDARFQAWITGQTGFPFLDAGMRCLQTTGWVDERLRRLLLSFATCHLWMAPALPARAMARLCTDYDPSVFYTNVRRVIGVSVAPPSYIPNPVRQSLTHDPEGNFIRKWVPELASLSTKHIHSPWDAPKSDLAQASIVFGQTYPMRMVDHVAAARIARRRLSPAMPNRSLDFSFRTLGQSAASRASQPSARPVSSLKKHPASRPEQLSLDLREPAHS